MMAKATLTTGSKDARSVAPALNVDNVKWDGLTVETRAIDGRIVSTVEAGSIETLISTLDDLITCQIAAENSLE